MLHLGMKTRGDEAMSQTLSDNICDIATVILRFVIRGPEILLRIYTGIPRASQEFDRKFRSKSQEQFVAPPVGLAQA